MALIYGRGQARCMIDIEAIRQSNPLPEVVGAVVSLKRVGKEWLGCCPFHADRSPSFTIYDDGRRFQCFGCGAHGDVFDFVQRLNQISLPEAAKMLRAGGETAPKAAITKRAAEELDRSANARAIWERTVAATGTLAEEYLRHRGLYLPIPPDIRFACLPCEARGSLPCLVAAIRDFSGTLSGIQRIWLAYDGQGKADVSKPKRSLGRVKGGAIRLGELDRSGTIIVCEGPEDGLSLLQMFDTPVWVAAGATFLPAMQFPRDIRSVVIAADNDATGEEETQKAARAFASRGLNVSIIMPQEGFKDFNDELRGRY